jgi:hypothetical protein
VSVGQFDLLHVSGDIDCQHIKPRQPIQVQQGSHLLSGFGAPDAALGVSGDYYFRRDGSGSDHIYFKASGSWSALV